MHMEATTTMTTKEIADRFHELAQKEKWFEIQDELFTENVQSIEPSTAPYLRNAAGKSEVRKKAMDWVSKVEHVHKVSTTDPIITRNHFAVGRLMDLSVKGIGRVVMDEIMLYEVRDGKIISEQFFY
jgi:ketosteroid isomerase-like protein